MNILDFASKGYSYKDFSIIPEMSDVKSRKEVNVLENGKLPVFTSPMASVINEQNYRYFDNSRINVIFPRNISIEHRKEYAERSLWTAFSLKEFKKIFIDEASSLSSGNVYKICIDIANGHMNYLYDVIKDAKILSIKNGYKLIIMTGNIANPESFREICKINGESDYKDNFKTVDYIRLGIGSGSCCITSSNTGIHYPIASLVAECYDIKMSYSESIKRYSFTGNFEGSIDKDEIKYDFTPKIIADGGIRNYDDVIKAIALGADYVMIGGIFGSVLESAAEKKAVFLNGDEQELDLGYNNDQGITPSVESLSYSEGYWHYKTDLGYYNDKFKIYSKIFGMASAEGQKAITGKKSKTSEGISKWVETKISVKHWSENMEDYFKSALSYCGKFSMSEFRGQVSVILNSEAERNLIND